MAVNHPSTILVTGAGGNLGSKLVAHLAALPWTKTIYALDIQGMTGPVFESPKVKVVFCDLSDANDTRWWGPTAEADGIAHFAVRNPAPTGDWDDAVIAIDMTAGLLDRAKPTCRFLFASSNHAMGQYKDLDWKAVGKLTSKTPPLPGTRLFSGGRYFQPNMYGATKLMGERLVRAKAIASGGVFTGIGIRIGWCLRAGDGPEKINHGGGAGRGVPGELVQSEAEQLRDLTWFRNMWLSDRDFCALFEAGFTADASTWPEPGIVINGMSNNRTMLWDLEEARTLTGYAPQDDVWTSIGIEPPGI